MNLNKLGAKVIHVLAIFLLMIGYCVAQSAGTGALTGTVTDPTGAVVPNVTVTVTNVDSGQARTVMTGADGSYRVPLLQPGNYEVKFDANGFKPVEIPSVTVIVSETAVLDRALEVGAQNQEVEVQANVEAVQTASSTLGTVVNSQVVTELPLNTRNFTNLISLSAGANASVNNATALGKGVQNIYVNGANDTENNYLMDGVSVDNYLGRGDTAELGTFGGLPVPDPDTIQEFKIQTSTYDSSYGRNSGANVNVVTKSGTNEFHGTGFEFFRNTVLNANDFFLKNSELQRGVPNTEGVLNQNQYGGVLGGPVKKDKLFFFVSIQDTWQKNGLAANGFSTGVNLPPLPGGNRGTCPAGATSLSQCDAATQSFVQALGANTCVANNPSANNLANSAAGVSLTSANKFAQVACNGSNINPVAVQLLQLKLANGTYYVPSSGLTPSSSNGYGYLTTAITDPAYYHERQGNGNWDYLINSKNTLSGRYYYASDPTISPFSDGLTAGPYVIGPTVGTQFGNDSATLKLTTILTSNLVNEARLNYQRQYVNQFNNSNFTAAQVGMTAINAAVQPQLPLIEIPSAFYMGTHDFSIANQNENTFYVGDQISWTHGKHSIRTGFELEHELSWWNYRSLQIGGFSLNSFGDFLLGLPGCAPGTSAAACAASQATGTTNGTSFSNVASIVTGSARFLQPPGQIPGLVHYLLSHADNIFVQDDFKVSSRLTLNLGLRWEYDGLPWDQRGEATSLWLNLINLQPIPGTGCVFNGVSFGAGAGGTGCSFVGYTAPANYNPSLLGPIPAGVYQLNKNITTQNNPAWDNFAPRLGFAWQPLSSSRLALRGGFGYFYERIAGGAITSAMLQGPPYGTSVQLSGAANYASSLTQPFEPASVAPATWNPRWVNFASGASSNIAWNSSGPLSSYFPTPLIYQYNLNAQYEFVHNWVLELGYVGSHGIHQLLGSTDYNGALLASPSDPLNGVTTNTTSGVAGPFVRAPYLGLLNGINIDSDYGGLKFNSLQATVRTQMSHGLQFQAAYTWSRAFYISEIGNPNDVLVGGNPVDNVPVILKYGINANYHPQRLIVNYNWAIPVGHPEGLRGKLIDGWIVSGVTTIQDGTPLTITDSRLGSIFGTPVTSNAELAPGMTNANVEVAGSDYARVAAGLNHQVAYLNPTAFIAPSAVSPNVIGNGYGFGDSGLGIVLGPGQDNWDISLSKVTRVGGLREDATLTFRTEFYNTFNHPQFSNPVLTFNTASTFGDITSASVNPRLIQFGLKYAF